MHGFWLQSFWICLSQIHEYHTMVQLEEISSALSLRTLNCLVRSRTLVFYYVDDILQRSLKSVYLCIQVTKDERARIDWKVSHNTVLSQDSESRLSGFFLRGINRVFSSFLPFSTRLRWISIQLMRVSALLFRCCQDFSSVRYLKARIMWQTHVLTPMNLIE